MLYIYIRESVFWHMSGEQNLRRHFIAHVSVAQHLRRHFAALCRYKSVTSYRLSLSLGTFVVIVRNICGFR